MATTSSGSSTRRAWGSLDRDQIVAAALELTKREGVESLSIRRLASEVGASRMALYRHVPDKEALLDLVANAIAEQEIVSGDTLEGPWPERLRSLARRMRQQLLTYPGLAELIMTRSNHGPGGLRMAETILDTIAAAGLDDRATADYYLVFVDIVLGRVHRETHGDPTSVERNEALLTAAEASTGLPRLRSLAQYLRAATPERVFEAELDVLVVAIERAVADSPAPH